VARARGGVAPRWPGQGWGAADGVVQYAKVLSATSGLAVKITDNCGWSYYYGHLEWSPFNENGGEAVVAGQVIGTMGSSGASSVHLHF